MLDSPAAVVPAATVTLTDDAAAVVLTAAAVETVVTAVPEPSNPTAVDEMTGVLFIGLEDAIDTTNPVKSCQRRTAYR